MKRRKLKMTIEESNGNRGIACFVFLAFAAMLHASSIGVAVNGTCAEESCPAVALPFSSTDVLSMDFTTTLPDGDTYLIDGSFTGSNSGDGSFSTNHLFQITYEGNAVGGVSAADTITVEAYYDFVSTVAVDFDRDLIGAFGPTIAASSSASSCVDAGVNGVVGCLGPVTPPGSFGPTTSFSLNSSGGAIVFDPIFSNNFGAGSPVGSYIVWGQAAALPAPSVPEPAPLTLLTMGLGLIFIARRARRNA
jgi:hypothetical protein